MALVEAELQKAIDCLTIRDVYLRASNAALMDDFEPRYESELERLEVQFKHIVAHSSVLALEDETNGKSCLFRVFVDLGMRWVLPNVLDEGDPVVKANIEGTMVAEYQMDGNPGAEALKVFALKNASYHIWPFWREYLSSLCLRMNLPKVVLPIRQLASNHDE